MMAVPSMLMVAPRGTAKEATLLDTPSLYSTVRKVTGKVAPLEEVENATSSGSRIFARKTLGLRPAKLFSNVG